MDEPMMSFPSLQNLNSYNMESHMLPAGPMAGHGVNNMEITSSSNQNERHLDGHMIPPHVMPGSMGSMGAHQSHHQSYPNQSSNNMDGSMFLPNFQNPPHVSHINPMEEYMMSTLGLQAKHSNRNTVSGAIGGNIPPILPESGGSQGHNHDSAKEDSQGHRQGQSQGHCEENESMTLPFPSLQSKNMTEEMVHEVADFIARKGEKREIKKQSLMKRLARQSETPEQAEVRKAKDRDRKARKRAAERLDYQKAVELREKVKHQRRLSRLAETPEQTVKRRERDRLRNAERRSAVAVLAQMYNDIKAKADESKGSTECEAEVLKLYYEYLRVRQQLKEGARILASCTQAAAEATLVSHMDVSESGDSRSDGVKQERRSRDLTVKEEHAERTNAEDNESDTTELADDGTEADRMADVEPSAAEGAAGSADKDIDGEDDSDSDDDNTSSSGSSGSTSRNDLDPSDHQYDPNLEVKKEPIDEALAQMGFYGLPISQLPPGQSLPFMPELNFNALGKDNENEADEEVEDFRVIEHQEQAVIYECGICCRMFMAVSNFQDHVNKHLKVTPYTCCDCYQVFSTRYGLRCHLEKESHETGVACALCDERFFTVDSLGAHASKHCMRQPRACDIVLAAKKRRSIGDIPKCQQQQQGQGAPTADELSRNGQSVAMDEAKVACPFCNEMFYKRALSRHIKVHTGEKPHSCQLCGKGFKEQYDLNDHMKIHEEGHPYRCDKCEKTFLYPAELRKHQQSHQDDSLQVACIVTGCNKIFVSQDSLKKHLAWHLENPNFKKSVEIVEPSVLYCNIQGCKESFNSQMMFRCHVEVHKDEPKCLLCGIKIVDKKIFKQHLQIHETLGDFKHPKDRNAESTNEASGKVVMETRSFTCPVCNLEFPQLTSLHDHMTDHNKWVCHLCGQEKRKRGELLKHLNHHYNKRDCVCEICGNSFVNRQVLKAHYIQHTEEKPYTCAECKATFRYSHGYVQHLRHHSGKRLECKPCGKLFLTKQGVDRHIKKTHPQVLENGKVPNNAYEHVVKSEAEILANGAVSHAVPPWIRQNTGFQKPGGSQNSSGDNTPRNMEAQETNSQPARSIDFKSEDDSSASEDN